MLQIGKSTSVYSLRRRQKYWYEIEYLLVPFRKKSIYRNLWAFFETGKSRLHIKCDPSRSSFKIFVRQLFEFIFGTLVNGP